jgi:hypothetical protein
MSTGSILPIKCKLMFTAADQWNHASNSICLLEYGTYGQGDTIMKDEVNRVCGMCGLEDRSFGSKILSLILLMCRIG